MLLQPQQVAARYNLGLIYERQEQYDLAVQCFEEVNALKPNTPDVFYHLGNCYHDTFQVGEQALSNSPLYPVIDLQFRIHDLHDTACFLQQMDLVITVDTAVAHLTGALGIPVWILLPFNPDWRWGSTGETTPWYPSARLFRQESFHNWDTAFKHLYNAFETEFGKNALVC